MDVAGQSLSTSMVPRRGPLLVDSYGRQMRKLRVSLLDACNFRCQYCMPKNPTFMSSKKWLSSDELFFIVANLVEQGIEEIRLTGGEPTIRADLVQIASKLSALNLKKLGLTSNGLLLARHLEGLRDTACRHLNLSIDSLTREGFNKIARFDGFDKTLAAIFQAKEMGFSVKLNVVLMRGLNDHEILDFIDFSEKYAIEVRFLELMQIGQACALGPNAFMSADEMIALVKSKAELTEIPVERDSTSFVFKTGQGGRIGFIAPVTKSFCGTCSRWRLTADGFLRTCLMSSNGLDLRGKTASEIRMAAVTALGMKPRSGHESTPDHMHSIGG